MQLMMKVTQVFLDSVNHLIQDVAAAQQLVEKRRVNDQGT